MARKPTTQQSKIEPPEGWKLHSPHGVLRCGPGPDDKLVRLHDVVTWLMNDGELPLAGAVDSVCVALVVNGLDGMFFLSDEGYATRIDAPSEFDQFTEPTTGETVARGLRASWLIKPYELARLVNTPGFDADFDEYKESPFEYANRIGSHSARHAITWALAHQYWGWGGVATVVTLQSVSPSLTAEAIKNGDGKNKRGEWLPEARALMKAESDAAKLLGTRIEDVAEKFGMSRQSFSGVLSRVPKGTRSKTSATSGQKQATR